MREGLVHRQLIALDERRQRSRGIKNYFDNESDSSIIALKNVAQITSKRIARRL
jgi:hypothetical protein